MALGIGVIVVVVVVVAIVAAVARWRRGSDEAHSVENYRHTLETLQEIGGRSAGGTVRVVGRSPGSEPGRPGPGEGEWPTTADGGDGEGGAGGVAAGGVAAGGVAAGGRPQAYFEDPGLSGGDPVAGTSRRTQTRALSAMNRRPRRLGAPIVVAVVVLAVLGLVAALGARSRGPHAKAALPAARTTTTHARSGTGGGGAGTKPTAPARRRRRTTPTTTTTTVPPKFTAVTSTATTATYVPPAGSYTVTFTTTSGACWVNVSSASGSTIMSQTLPPGTSKVVTATGKTTVILGAPSVIGITIDHEPVVLPSGYQTPFTMTLLPSATG